jgi:hypothetical protein
MFGVFQNIQPPPPTPLTARRVCTLRLWCGGGRARYSVGGEEGGVHILESPDKAL